MDIPVRRPRRKTTKINAPDQKSIRGPKDTSHIVHTPDIVQNNDDWRFLRLPELIHR